MISYALHDIFHRRNELITNDTEAEVKVSCVEIYCEKCYDLLACSDGHQREKELDLQVSAKGETILKDMQSLVVTDTNEAIACFTEATKLRSTGSTAMNEQSSRSHAIFTISLRITRSTGVVVSKLHLVDLAGSEGTNKTLATGTLCIRHHILQQSLAQ